MTSRKTLTSLTLHDWQRGARRKVLQAWKLARSESVTKA